MWIKQEVNSYELGELLWGQAKDTWEHLEELNKIDEAMQVLEEIVSADGSPVDLMSINDILAYEPETVYEAIGLNEDGEEPKEWTISTGEFEELKRREVLSTEQLEYIEGEFYGSELANVSEQDFKDNDIELDDTQIEELDSIVA